MTVVIDRSGELAMAEQGIIIRRYWVKMGRWVAIVECMDKRLDITAFIALWIQLLSI